MTIRATTYAAFLVFLALSCLSAIAQDQSPDTWTIHADSIDPAHYFGVTVANGMIGLVSSTDPFRAKDIVLNGAFDLYGRGRVSATSSKHSISSTSTSTSTAIVSAISARSPTSIRSWI